VCVCVCVCVCGLKSRTVFGTGLLRQVLAMSVY
jgi:hypothetical protein